MTHPHAEALGAAGSHKPGSTGSIPVSATIALALMMCSAGTPHNPGDKPSGEASSRQGVPYWPLFVLHAGPLAVERAAQCRQESNFTPTAVSRVGAQGLMQAMPTTWTWYQEMGWVVKGAAPTEPASAIAGGCAHMAWLNGRTHLESASLAAYNWGHLDRIRRAQYRAEMAGLPSEEWTRAIELPAETADYIERIPNKHVPWVRARVPQ